MKKSTFSMYAMLLLAGMALPVSLLATIHTVQVANYSFSPSSLNVTVGDTIKWQWVSGNHTTTSSNIPSGAATWDQPINSTHLTYEYTVTVAGTYNYVCTPHVGMGMIASFVATTTTGISENNKNAVHIYPNPAKDKVIITLDKVPDNAIRIQFIDLTGKTVLDRSIKTQKELSLGVGDLTRGCYFVKVCLSNETVVQQIILTE